jgi:hypothetical protein
MKDSEVQNSELSTDSEFYVLLDMWNAVTNTEYYLLRWDSV